MESLVSVTPQGAERTIDPEPERERILRLTRQPRSIAEVAALVKVPLGVARVLVADLEAEGLLHVADHGMIEPGRNLIVLERVRDGLRRL